MTKYELSITRDYVPGWTVTDAIRELFQNALDQEVVMSSNAMFWDYDEDRQRFLIGNKSSILAPKTLLLGSTTKADDPGTIGKFGEGYKIATLVLTRLGKKVTFFNYGAREVWTARFSKSKKYGAEILVFDVDKKYPWAVIPDNNLTITVEGITLEELAEITSSNLHMQTDVERWETTRGDILTDEHLSGKMFVNGLYICDGADFSYGYDFNPRYIKLDRDRKLIDNFDLKWTTSQMWLNTEDEEAIRTAAALVATNRPDVAYVRNVKGYGTASANKFMAVANHAYDAFKEKHGANAIPISSTDELENLAPEHNAVIVSSDYAEIVKLSSSYEQPKYKELPTLSNEIEGWIAKYGSDLSDDAIQTLIDIGDEFA